MSERDVDWSKLEAEYITTEISYQALAEKYGLSRKTVSYQGKALGWPEKRKNHKEAVRQRILKEDARKKVSRAARVRDVADKLLGKLERMIDAEELTAKEAKSISGSLRDIAEIHGVKSDLDMQEQELRLQKLRRENERDADTGASVTVTIGGDEAWQM